MKGLEKRVNRKSEWIKGNILILHVSVKYLMHKMEYLYSIHEARAKLGHY